jgi:phosphatidylserine/phosphatidylglycerophosphate/cardiolipin synthase-like enzyme
MAAITDARVWCNNEVAYLAWKTDGKIADCLGFMLTRVQTDTNGKVTRRILPAWAAFNTQSNPKWEEQDTSVWPIQKFSWRDLTLRRSRDTTTVRDPDFHVKYEIVAVGKENPGRKPVPKSPDADPSKYEGDPIPLFFCTDPKETNEVFVSTNLVTANDRPVISAGFTNGILSTQNMRKQLKTPAGRAPTKGDLTDHLNTDKPDPIRSFLTADAEPLITDFMARAKKENCDLFLALYELNDPVLLDHLVENADRVHLILSTAGATKPKKGSGEKPKWDITNTVSRALLRDKVAEFHDRMFNNASHIGHNKFAVLVDRATNEAKAVLAGSTNWTFTGLCTQTNNVIVIDDPAVGAAYLAYWNRLLEDKLPVPDPISAPNSNKQGETLRSKDMTPAKGTLQADPKTAFELWYSPNTKSATKPAKDPARPPDLDVVFKLMEEAEKAIFFLTFMPSMAGDNSVIMQSLDVALKKDLLVLGAISDGRALPNEEGAVAPVATPAKKKTTAKKKTKKKKATKKKTSKKKTAKKAKKKTTKKAKKKTAKKSAAKKKQPKAKKKAAKKRRAMAMAARADVKKSAPVAKRKSGAKSAKAESDGPQPKRAIYRNPKAPKVLMVRAAAIGAFDLIGNWEQEMLKYGQAIIHDKIVVIDPLSDNCVVITGSHNLGYKASYANDENLLIIKGNKALATSYMVHILDVQDHYKFRAILEQQALDRAMGKGGPKPPVGKGILQTDGSWQDKYVDGKPDAEQAYFLELK